MNIYIYRSKEKIDDAKGYVLNPMIDMFYMKNNVRNGEPQEASSRPPTSKNRLVSLKWVFNFKADQVHAWNLDIL
jgi:hypothetical protein